jgi:hypothetical protein
MAIVCFTLQLIPQTQDIGDQLRWWFCLSPAYCVTHSIVFSSSKGLLETAYGDKINLDLWAWKNCKGDAVALVVTFVAGLILVTLVEADLLWFLRKLSVQSVPPPK